MWIRRGHNNNKNLSIVQLITIINKHIAQNTLNTPKYTINTQLNTHTKYSIIQPKISTLTTKYR